MKFEIVQVFILEELWFTRAVEASPAASTSAAEVQRVISLFQTDAGESHRGIWTSANGKYSSRALELVKV
jgi:hypothetical protein